MSNKKGLNVSLTERDALYPVLGSDIIVYWCLQKETMPYKTFIKLYRHIVRYINSNGLQNEYDLTLHLGSCFEEELKATLGYFSNVVYLDPKDDTFKIPPLDLSNCVTAHNKDLKAKNYEDGKTYWKYLGERLLSVIDKFMLEEA